MIKDTLLKAGGRILPCSAINGIKLIAAGKFRPSSMTYEFAPRYP